MAGPKSSTALILPGCKRLKFLLQLVGKKTWAIEIQMAWQVIDTKTMKNHLFSIVQKYIAPLQSISEQAICKNSLHSSQILGATPILASFSPIKNPYLSGCHHSQDQGTQWRPKTPRTLTLNRPMTRCDFLQTFLKRLKNRTGDRAKGKTFWGKDSLRGVYK